MATGHSSNFRSFTNDYNGYFHGFSVQIHTLCSSTLRIAILCLCSSYTIYFQCPFQNLSLKLCFSFKVLLTCCLLDEVVLDLVLLFTPKSYEEPYQFHSFGLHLCFAWFYIYMFSLPPDYKVSWSRSHVLWLFDSSIKLAKKPFT